MVAHWSGKPKVGGSRRVEGGWIFQIWKNQSWKGWEMLMKGWRRYVVREEGKKLEK